MINLKSISWDLATYSSVDLAKCGVYRYCESEDFEILLAAYSVDGGAVRVVDLACGEKLPEEILDALEDETVEKWSYNSQFERICLSRLLGYPAGNYLAPASWRCSMVWASTLGLPRSLEQLGISPCGESGLRQAAEEACAAGSPIHNMPFPVSPQAVYQALLAADGEGRRHS